LVSPILLLAGLYIKLKGGGGSESGKTRRWGIGGCGVVLAMGSGLGTDTINGVKAGKDGKGRAGFRGKGTDVICFKGRAES